MLLLTSIVIIEFQRRSKRCGYQQVCGHCTRINISVRSVVILADLPNIPSRMPEQCSSVYQSLFAVPLWCADRHMDLQSFHLCPVQITVGLNTSIEWCCRMWQPQQRSIKENILSWLWRIDLYYMFAFFLISEVKKSPNFEFWPICK
jgi:hypothetical protein